jgi:predicted extracellular nuclease
MTLHTTLQEPEIIAIQEVENETVLRALVGRPELEHEYGYVWENGPDLRGIDVAMLYRKDRVQIYGYEVHQGCTTLKDGLGPDGNGDVQNPVNAITCDTNGDGKNDGNRLFSRPPLMVHAWVCLTNCQDGQAAQGLDFWVIINHFKSKIEDSRTEEYTLPRRIEQAEFVAGLVNQLQWESPQANLVVAGDLNDFPASQPLTILLESGLRDAVQGIPYPERYSYLFQGISQVLDYGLFDLELPLACVGVVPSHINADYPVVYAGVNETVYRSSDHDPLTFQLKILDLEWFLPMVQR